MSMAMDIPISIPTQEGDHIHVPAPLSSSTAGPGYGGSGGGGGSMLHHHHHHHHDPMSHIHVNNNSPASTALNGPLEDHHGSAMVGYNGGSKSSGGAKAAVRYRECLKNHAAAMGGAAMDGCGEFMPSGDEGTIEALNCSACGCHRNFHRKESEGSAAAADQVPLNQWYHHHLHSPPHLNRVGRKVIVGHPTHKSNVLAGHHEAATALLYPTGTLIAAPTSRGPMPHQMIMPYTMAGSLPSESDHEQDEEEDHMHHGSGGPGAAVVARPTQMVKKRFRTKFTPEQKEKMMSFAEKVGWKIQRTEESVVQQFCQEIGVKRRVLKVWMHNNKHSLNAKKMINAANTTDLNPPPSLNNNNPNSRQTEKVKVTDATDIANSAISVLSSAELSIDGPENSTLIHMDVDKSFLPIPAPVKAAIFECFARQNIAEAESEVTSSIREFVKSTYRFPVKSNTEFIYADGSLALFNKLILCCIQDCGTLCFPAGTNGNYVSAAKLLKTTIATIPTEAADGFKLTEKSLSKALETAKKPWVYISGPTINPTGMIYTNEEMRKILSTCNKLGAKVIIDTSFSGLEFNREASSGWDLAGSFSDLTNQSFDAFLLGELSPVMLSGALNLGFLVFTQSTLVDSFSSFTGLSKPHGTVKYAIKKLLGSKERGTGDLADATAEQIKILQSRSKRLKEVLEKNGWDVLEPSAGISMVAKPSAHLGKSVSVRTSPKDGETKEGSEQKLKIDSVNVREAVYKATGLCINSSQWTGIPDYCRFTIAGDDREFEQSLECIAKFKSLVS